MLRALITAITILTLGLSLSAQNQDTDKSKEMDQALSEMSKMMDSLDLSKILQDEGIQELMKGFDMGQMNLDSINIEDMMGLFGEGGMPDMKDQDIQKMMEQSMKMFEGLDMTEMNKMLEGMDIEKMLEGMDLEKMLEGMDLEKMLEGFDFGQMAPPGTPEEQPVDKNGKKLKKI